MNSKLIKIFSAIFIVILITAGSASFYLHKKLRPEALKSDVIEFVETNYPNLLIKINSLNVSFGFTTEITVNEINLSSKGNINSKMFSVKKASVRIPILSILTGGGTIKISVAEPLINLITKKKTNNWEYGLKKEVTKSKAIPVKNKSNQNVDVKNVGLPVFLMTSQLNARFNNLKVSITDAKGEVNKFAFDSIQLKDIGIKKPMALKLSSEIILGKSKDTSFRINAIGELNIKSLIEDKVINANIMSRFSKIKLANKVLEIDEVSSNAKIVIRKDKTGRIDLDIKSEELIEGKLSILIFKDTIKGEIESFKVSIENLLKAIDQKITGVDLNNSWINIKGGLDVDKNKKLNPGLTITPTEPIFYKFQGRTISIDRAMLSLKNKKINVSTTIKAFKGIINFKAVNKIDINKKIDFSKLDPTIASLVVNGVEIPKSMLKGSNKKESSKKKKKKISPIVLPVKLNIELKNIIIGTEVISGSGQIVAVKDSVAIKNFRIKHGDGVVKLNATTKGLSKNPKHSFNIEIKDLSAQLLNSFLDNKTPQITGLINMSAVGKASNMGESYEVFIKGNSRNGELKDYDLSEMANTQILKLNKLPYFKKKPVGNVSIPQDYDKIIWDIKAKPSKITIKKALFIGINKKIEIKSAGYIKAKGQSEIFVNAFDTKGNYLGFLKKYFQTTSLPMRLAGPGYDLKVDYDYTMKILLKKLEKKIKSEVKKKVKVAAKQELKKLFKGKKVKSLLKGLFK